MKKIPISLPKFFLMLIFSTALLSFAYSQSNYQYECVSLGDDGSLTIKIWNPQKGKNYKLEQARKDAIQAILFSGIPSNNDCVAQKPILQKKEEQEKFRNIEKDFFSSNGVWSKYTQSSGTETTIPESLGEKEWKVFQVSVAKNLLRKYLEEKNIVKPLNTGF